MIRPILSVALLVFAGAASADRTLEIIEYGVEASLEHVTMPGSAAGTVIFRICGDCESQSLRVNTDTRYFLADTALPLSEFHEAVDEVEDNSPEGGSTLVGIYYDRESSVVTRIKLFASK